MKLTLLLALLIGSNVCAQTYITGIVTDSLNNPVPFASVYLSNTTMGTSANNLGAYKLTVPQNGSYELTITCIGYASYSKKIHTEGKNLIVNVKLQTNAQTLNEITVTAKEGDRKKNYARFIKVFLGETKNSQSCKILNPEDLRLHYDNEKKMLHGYSVKPLIIENRALGYTITYDLKSFEDYPSKLTTRYYVSPYFQLMNGSFAEKEIWERNRLITYYGSRMHFMRTLYADKLKEEKFQLFESNYDEAIKANITDKPLSVNNLRSAKNADNIIIYSVKPIVVAYDNPKLTSHLGRSQRYSYISIITFTNSIKIYENGYFEDGYFLTWEGKMSKERMADMLPYDFQPDLLGFSSIQAHPEKKIALRNSHKIKDMPVEKVYLHLDRFYYSSNDDIWFKAYLTDAVSNKLIDNSNNLYVELISPDSTIIDRKIIRLDNGLGNGDFRLKDSIPSGNYQIRAYTNYMRNFGEVFFFKREIVIENQLGIKTPEQLYPKENSGNPDIQFFPEGGPLIEGVPATVGFKAVSPSGYGINIRGKVITSKGDTVASFESTNFGMGSFTFTSNRKLTYVAEGITDSGVPFNVALPQPLKKGYALKLTDNNNQFFQVTIKTNQATLDQYPSRELVIAGTSRGLLCLMSHIKIRSTVTSALLPKKEFPQGIASVALLDSSGVIYGERLVYIQKKSPVQISVVADKTEYAPREKVNLKINVRDTSNNPVTANVSVAVVDGTQVMSFAKKPDICSYLLLESEIKGNIEQPYSYFDTANYNREKALDNLLLTQGWRTYIWKELADTTFKQDYPVEKGLTLSGRLKYAFGNKPIANINISLAVFDSIHSIYKFTKTDSDGEYYFDELNFSGRKAIVVSATNKKNAAKGMISIDSLQGEFAPINYQWKNPPLFVKKEISAFRQEVEIKYDNLKQYKVTDTITLNTLVVKAWKPKTEVDDGHTRIYGQPDKSITVTPQMWSYPNVLVYLEGRIEWPYAGRLVGGSGAQLLLVDGIPVDQRTLRNIPLTQVDKIEILISATKLSMFGSKGAYGVLCVFLKKGGDFTVPTTPLLSSMNRKIQGYYQARSFYAPHYDVPMEKFKPDLRTTIFWEPNVVTDSEGNASCSFFNGDNKSTIQVDAEGITLEGTPIVGKTSFTIE